MSGLGNLGRTATPALSVGTQAQAAESGNFSHVQQQAYQRFNAQFLSLETSVRNLQALMNEQSNKVLQQLCAQLPVLINEAVTASVRDTLEIPSINHNTKVKYYRVLVQGLFTKLFL